MNRPICFRFWDTNSRRFIGLETFLGDGYGDLNDVDPAIQVSQFTGLRDANGKDLYEGDFVQWCASSRWRDGGKGTIVWSDCAFKIHPIYRHGSPALIREHVGIHHIEVIGNLYEHPTLLNP